MQYREFGKTGQKVSTLGFGCMRLPVVGDNNAQVDEKATNALVGMALEKGINYFDTAWGYHGGNSEATLGKALDMHKARSTVFVADKMPPWEITCQNDMEKIFIAQCARLRSGYIDFYLLHNINKTHWAKMRELGALDFLHRLQKEGRVGHVGFSFHDELSVFKDIVDSYDWDFCQIQYNYLDEELQAGTDGLDYAAKKGMGVVVMEPLRGGNLARKPPEEIQALWDSAQTKYSPAEWALRWLFDKPEISVVLSGMNEKRQMEENCRIASEHVTQTMTNAQFNLIYRARELFLSRFKTPCTTCAYCMPCPSGVNIPGIFRVFNEYGLFGDKNWCGGMYNANMAATESTAANCVQCGQCEEACPQKIAIIETLQEAHRELSACGMPR